MRTISIVSIGIVFSLLWANFVDLLYRILGEGSGIYDGFFTYFFSPIWEELLYRYFPLFIANKLGKDYVIPFVIASSILFGWGHEGGSHEGVLLQGVLGVSFSLAYIKSGYKLYVPILIHIIYNFLV